MINVGLFLPIVGALLFFVALIYAVGAAAYRRGRSPFSFMMLSLLLTPVLSYVLLLIVGSDREGEDLFAGRLSRCPSCAELVQIAAIKCRYCSVVLLPNSRSARRTNPYARASGWLVLAGVILIAAGLGLQMENEVRPNAAQATQSAPDSGTVPAPRSKAPRKRLGQSIQTEASTDADANPDPSAATEPQGKPKPKRVIVSDEKRAGPSVR